jgi:UDP-2,3-diacylglucosamine hydrolase
MDVNSEAVQKIFSEYNFPSFLIHGHTHRLKNHEYIFEKHKCQRWVLGDWHGEGNYISFKDDQLKYNFLNS